MRLTDGGGCCEALLIRGRRHSRTCKSTSRAKPRPNGNCICVTPKSPLKTCRRLAVAASRRRSRAVVRTTSQRCKVLAAGAANCAHRSYSPRSVVAASPDCYHLPPRRKASHRAAAPRLASNARLRSPPACARSTIACGNLPSSRCSSCSRHRAASGCAALRRGPVPEDVAACRDLTQQGVTAMEMGDWTEAEELLATRRRSLARRRRPATAILPKCSGTAARPTPRSCKWNRPSTLDDNDSALIVRYGEMLLGTGATEKALERADEAISLNPKLASAWALRGRVYWRMNETDRALADLQRSLQFAPDTSDVLMDVAAIYRQRGQHDRCLTTLQHLLDTYPPGQGTQLAYWMEGLTLADLGRPDQAAESLRTANQQGPAERRHFVLPGPGPNRPPDEPAAATTAAQEALAANPAHAPSRQLLTELAARPSPAAPLVAGERNRCAQPSPPAHPLQPD